MSIQKRKEPTSRQRQAEETKQLLINKAFSLFNTHGFEAVGVRDIASAAGVSTGAFYHHFKSKEELVFYRAIGTSDWFSSLSPADFAGDSCYEKLHDFCSSYLAGAVEADGPEMIHHILSWKETSAGLRGIFLELLSLGQERGEFSTEKSAGELCDFLLACYRGAVYDWYRNDGRTDLRTLIWEHIHYPLEYFRRKCSSPDTP